MAGAARVGYGLALALTGWAGPLHREKALLRTHPAGAVAHGACCGRGAFRRAGAVADFASHHGRNVDCGLLAGESILQRNFHIVAQIVAALRAAALPASAHFAEHFLENIGKSAAAKATCAATRPAAALLALGIRVVTQPVIRGPLVGVLQDVVGFVQFLELDFGIRIVRVPVGVKLHGELAIG